jgi:hypothetical protein
VTRLVQHHRDQQGEDEGDHTEQVGHIAPL